MLLGSPNLASAGVVTAEEVNAYARRALAIYDAPGLAIAVVQDGKPQYLAGVGVRELGKPERMDADTVFTIASLTKAFTATAAAAAVDENVIDWDQPVVTRLPEFKLYDPQITAEATFRDLLSHRVGVFGSFFNGLALDRDGVIALLPYEKPVEPFRAGFRYSNILYAAAGAAVARAMGRSWDDDIRARLFEPLGMVSSSSSALALTNAANRASSHVREADGVVHVDPFRPGGWWSMDNHAPAGAINSTARDMARWLEFQLGDGGFRGRRILSAEAFAETHRLQVPYPARMSKGPNVTSLEGIGYALGWELATFGGDRVVWHGGLFRGHNSIAFLLPDRQLGVFVFANSRTGENGLTSGMAQWLVDRYLGRPARDWAGEQRIAYEMQSKAKAQKLQQLLERQARRRAPSAVRSAYAGEYIATGDWPRYGVDYRAGVLRVDLQGVAEPYFATLTHWDGESFRPSWNETIPEYKPAELIVFTLGAHAQVRSMLLYKSGAAEPKEYFRIAPQAGVALH